MAHKPTAAQCSSRLDLAPCGTWSVSSRYSWRASTALGEQSEHHSPDSTWDVTAARSTRHRAPPAPPGCAGCSAQPSSCNRPRKQTDRQPLSRLATKISARQPFPTEKNTVGKEKQKTETTRKTPLSLSHGTDAMKSPAPRDGKHLASSPPSLPSGTELPAAASPRHGREPAGAGRSPIYWGVAQTSFFQSIN